MAATLDAENDVVATGRGTANQIAKLFRVNKNDINRKLDGLAPVGRRKGFPLYDVREAAGLLVEPTYEIEDRIKRMNPADIPPLLGKEIWNGQRARLAYERENGDLWPTDEVVAALAATFNECRMVFLLMLDNVERQSGTLTAQQRSVISRLAEGGINAMKESLVAKFAGMAPPVDNIAGMAPAAEDEL